VLLGERDLADRIVYDPERSILFLNFEGMHIRTEQDIAAVQEAVEERCRKIGKRVAVIVNYAAYRIDDEVLDAYARMIRYMEENYYTTVTRYSTGAFLRMKLGDALTRRDVAPHIFETEDDARAFLANA
jgi:propionate CoA-transferase